MSVVPVAKSQAKPNRVFGFLEEVRIELRKATWPWNPKEHGARRYKELTDSTIVVVVAMLLLGGYVALWDLVLNFLLGLLTTGGH